jgi:hypothetical protein
MISTMAVMRRVSVHPFRALREHLVACRVRVSYATSGLATHPLSIEPSRSDQPEWVMRNPQKVPVGYFHTRCVGGDGRMVTMSISETFVISFALIVTGASSRALT